MILASDSGYLQLQTSKSIEKLYLNMQGLVSNTNTSWNSKENIWILLFLQDSSFQSQPEKSRRQDVTHISCWMIRQSKSELRKNFLLVLASTIEVHRPFWPAVRKLPLAVQQDWPAICCSSISRGQLLIARARGKLLSSKIWRDIGIALSQESFGSMSGFYCHYSPHCLEYNIPNFSLLIFNQSCEELISRHSKLGISAARTQLENKIQTEFLIVRSSLCFVLFF